MFGTGTQKISNEFAYDNSNKSNEKKVYEPDSIYADHPVKSYYRFWMKPGSQANIIFLDDVTNFTEEQTSNLDILGFRQGLTIHEHGIQQGGKWRQYTCPNKGLRLTPRLRLYFTKQTRCWNAIGKAMAEGSQKEFDAILKGLFLADKMDVAMFNEIVTNEKQRHYFSDILKTPLGGTLDCPICDEDAKRNRPSVKVFRTIIDLREWTDKNGDTRKNELKLLPMGRKYNGQFVSKERAQMLQNLRPGISGWEFSVGRVSEQKNGREVSAGTGTNHDLFNCHEFEAIREMNDYAIFELTKDSIKERLEDNNFFYEVAWRLENDNEEPNVDNILSDFTDGTSALIPWVPDYYDILLPKTPTFMNEFVLKKTSYQNNSQKNDWDDIPF